MNPKTENTHGNSPPEFPPSFRPWLLLFTLGTIGLVFLTPILEESSRRVSEGFHLTLYPWVHATAITISNGLDVFSGAPLTPPSEGQRASILVGLLLAFVIGPTLLFFTWRERAKNVQRRWHPPALLLGGVLVASLSVPSLYLAVRQWHISESMQEAQNKGFQRDAMIHSLQLIARDAREYRVLPPSRKGGGGTFAGYLIPGDLASTGDYTCEVVGTADTLLTVKATSKSRYPMHVDGTASASGVLRFNVRETEGR